MRQDRHYAESTAKYVHSLSRVTTARSVLLVSLMFLLCCAGTLHAQYYNVNDERYKFLALKKAEVRLQEARQQYENNKSLLKEQLISQDVFDASKSAYRISEIEFQQALLAVVFEKPYITIESAVKYVAEGGGKRVRLTVRNSSGGAPDMAGLSTLEDSADASSLAHIIEYDRLSNVYVSLKDEGSIISRPYEQKIDVLPYGETRTLTFDLLADVENVVVSISYGGDVSEKKIRLTKDFSANPLAIVSTQFSQEANLSGQARYDLKLEQYSGRTTEYQLIAVNLPEQIMHEFTSAGTGARVSQVRFAEEHAAQELYLTLFLPERGGEGIHVDSPITFSVLAVDAQLAGEIARSNYRVSAPRLAEMGGAQVQLELIPRGIGELELNMERLYYQIDDDKPLVMTPTVRNTGSLSLFNIGISVRAPYGWVTHITPERVDRLSGGGDEAVRITCEPPPDIPVGDYEFVVGATASVNNRVVSAPEKTVRATVESSKGMWGTVLMIGLMFAVVAGGAVFFVRMSRR